MVDVPEVGVGSTGEWKYEGLDSHEIGTSIKAFVCEAQ